MDWKQMLTNGLNAIFDMIVGAAGLIAEDTTILFQGQYSTIWSWVCNVANNVVEPIAVMIVVIFFLLAIVEKATGENLNLETMFKEIIKLCFGLYLVSNSVEIVVNLINLGNGILSDVMRESSEIVVPELFEKSIFDGMNVVVAMLSFLIMFICLFLQEILFLLMKVVALTRILEIAIRTALSPLALADTFSGHFLSSHALNFIRSFFSVCVQGVFIAIIANFVPMLWVGVVKDASGDIWAMCGTMFSSLPVLVAATILMFKSGSIAKEMMGGR